MSLLDNSAANTSALLDPVAALIKNPFQQKVLPTGEMPADFPLGFCIVEFVDGVAQTPILQLVGNMMPFQPFPWGGEQKLSVEYYPGNREPSVHVMGYRDKALVIKGRFKDKRFRSPAYYGAAYQFSQLYEELIQRGNLLKFGMNGSAGSWIRYGFLEKADFEMQKLSWINYEFTFTVVSDKQPVNNYFAQREKSAPTAINANLIAAATNLQQNALLVPTSMPQSLAGLINGYISTAATSINVVTGFVDDVISTAKDLQASADRALGLIKNARTFVATTQLSLCKLGIGGFAGLSSSSVVTNPSKNFSDSYTNIQFISEIIAALADVLTTLSLLQAKFENVSQTIPIARYRVISGDSLQKIAVRYYGNAANWEDIYKHNKLQTTVITVGQALEIPKL